VQVPAYLLTMANGKPTLKPSTAAEEGSCKPQYSGQPGSNIPPTWSLECRGASMAMLANSIGAMDSRDYVAYNTPVMDTTGLKGLYDFDLKWTPKFFLAQAGSGGVSLYQALEALGLDLELKFTPRPGIVIDSVIREPTANAPDLASIMPPLPSPQFDVATIKPSDPNVRRGDVRYGGNEINIQGIPLKTLIKIAWDLDPRNDDTLVAPKWLDSDKIDIHAKASQSEIGNNTMGRTNTVNPDALMPMLRDLLIDRFQIKYHMEERPIDAYALLADHPKLTPADPKEHTACGTALSDNGKDPSQTNIMLDSNQSCWNTTMDQFAGQLHRIAPDYFFYPVVDDTGIKGAWDFTLYWSSARLTQNGGPGTQAAPEGAPAALDPNGAISLFDAIRKQLGLKIEKQKHTEPVLVIDQISEKPTEN
jgi:uncharacterized protein (TIGR03435 family)